MESILAPSFKHIDSDGKLLELAQEIAAVEKVSFTMNPSEQLVDIAGDTAVVHGVDNLIDSAGDTALVHGVNALNDSGKVLAHDRFTDAFVLQNSSWIAHSARETTLG